MVNVGTFCGHACKVQKIHTDAGLFKELRYYRCPNCQTVMTTPFKDTASKPYWCRCRRKMVYQFSVPVDTDERRELAVRGQVFNPHAVKPEPWPCARCGEDQYGAQIHRPDGIVCRECYAAEEHPPMKHTAEQVEVLERERELAKAAFRREMEDRQERAYQQREQEQR